MRKPAQKSETDWERVNRQYDANAPIPYDPEDGPYDPNDEEATKKWLSEAIIVRGPGQRGPADRGRRHALRSRDGDWFAARRQDWLSP